MSNYNYNTLCHHGIKGQKWGIRRFQNDDGTLTAEGRKRYGVDSNGQMSKEGKKQYKQDVKQTRRDIAGDYTEIADKHIDEFLKPIADAASKRGLNSFYIDSKTLNAMSKAADKKAEQELIKKYGSMAVNDFNKHNDRIRIGKNITEAVLATVGIVGASYFLINEFK